MGRVARPRRRGRHARRRTRQRRRSARATSSTGLASPDEFDGIEATELDLWREELLTVPTAEKVALAIELEAATKAVDPRIRGLRSASYGDAAAESAVVNSLGVEVVTRRTVCSCSAFAMASDGNETQTGGGFSMGRAFTDLDLEKAAHDAAERSVRLLGATQPASRRLPVVLDPQVTRSLVSLIGSALSAECDAAGAVDVRRARGRGRRGAGRHPRRRPDARRRVRRRQPRRRGRAHAAARAHRPRPARRVPAQRLHRSPRRHHQHRFGRARRVQVDAGCGRACAASRARAADAPRRSSRRCPKRSSCSR